MYRDDLNIVLSYQYSAIQMNDFKLEKLDVNDGWWPHTYLQLQTSIKSFL